MLHCSTLKWSLFYIEMFNVARFYFVMFNVALFNIEMFNVALFYFLMFNVALFYFVMLNVALFYFVMFNVTLFYIEMFTVALFYFVMFNTATVCTHLHYDIQHTILLQSIVSTRNIQDTPVYGMRVNFLQGFLFITAEKHSALLGLI